MRHLQVDQALLPPGVQMMYYEWTEGAWGTALAEPAEEVQHLKHYWLERKRYTVPMAIWAGPKDSTPDGGFMPRESPMKTALHISAGPTFFVLDGHGVVRHWQQGYYTYQKDMARVIDLLVQERDHQRAQEQVDHAVAQPTTDVPLRGRTPFGETPRAHADPARVAALVATAPVPALGPSDGTNTLHHTHAP
jgi:hypothetical protein